MAVTNARIEGLCVHETLASLSASDLCLLHEGVFQLLCLAWLVQELDLHPGWKTEVSGECVTSPVRECSGRRVSFRDEHGGDLEEVRIFEMSFSEQIVRVSPQVPVTLSDFLVEELDHVDGRSKIFQSIQGAWVALALSETGSEVVLKSLELACEADLHALLQELEDHVLELACSASGSAVLQFCVEQLSPSDAKFVVTALGGHAVSVAEDPFGREVVCTLFEHLPPCFVTQLVDELPSRILGMCAEPQTLAGLRRAGEREMLEEQVKLDVVHVPVLRKSLHTDAGRCSLLRRVWLRVGLLCARGG
jgi:hypothetical protein